MASRISFGKVGLRFNNSTGSDRGSDGTEQDLAQQATGNHLSIPLIETLGQPRAKLLGRRVGVAIRHSLFEFPSTSEPLGIDEHCPGSRALHLRRMKILRETVWRENQRDEYRNVKSGRNHCFS